MICSLPSGFGHFGGWRNLPILISTAPETARLATHRRTEAEYSIACKSAALRRKMHRTQRRRLWVIPFVAEPYNNTTSIVIEYSRLCEFAPCLAVMLGGFEALWVKGLYITTSIKQWLIMCDFHPFWSANTTLLAVL